MAGGGAIQFGQGQVVGGGGDVAGDLLAGASLLVDDAGGAGQVGVVVGGGADIEGQGMNGWLFVKAGVGLIEKAGAVDNYVFF